jgi:uncharacterized membrane protein YdjX (TVP38/TMEM64 family)
MAASYTWLTFALGILAGFFMSFFVWRIYFKSTLKKITSEMARQYNKIVSERQQPILKKRFR